MALVRKKQDPADKLDWGFDWADPTAQGGPFLQSGEAITTSTWTVYDDNWNVTTDIPASGAIMTSTKTSVFFGPAVSDSVSRGETYYLTNHIITNQGREKDWSYQFTMEEQ